MRKHLAGAAMAGLLVGGAAGAWVALPALSGAQSTDPTNQTAPSKDGAPASDAGRLGRHRWPLQRALEGLVDDGTLTADQAGAVREAVKEERGEIHDRIEHQLQVMADTLGLGADEIKAALRDGTTPAELADQQGVAHSTLIEALLVQPSARIDQALADGKLTDGQAGAARERITERVTTFVENGPRPRHR